MATNHLILSHVKLVADDPKHRNRYQFDDLAIKSRKTRYKNKTLFKNCEPVIGRHYVLFTLTDSATRRHPLGQQHTVVLDDLTYANNFYQWLIKHNPGIEIKTQWQNKLVQI